MPLQCLCPNIVHASVLKVSYMCLDTSAGTSGNRGGARPSFRMRGGTCCEGQAHAYRRMRSPLAVKCRPVALASGMLRRPALVQRRRAPPVRVMRWRGGWAARVPTPSLYTSLTLALRNQSMAGGSVATRCTSPSRAHEDAAVGDAANGSARRHLPRFQQFQRPLEPTGCVERGCACAGLNVHMCEARTVER